MDYTKLIILILACMGGFMATSYSSLASKKGWPVGNWFDAEKPSILMIGGFICQWGSVLISFFVNPWWSAFIVLTAGFVGYTVLGSILKVHTQILATILVVVSLILIPLFVFR